MSIQEAKNIALEILTRRDNSEKEMRAKLTRKNVDADTVEEVIAWLTEKRLLNDYAFAQQKAASIFRTKMCGPQYIKHKLREVGIAGEISDEVVSELGDREEWNSRAQQAIEQWQRVHPKHKDDTVRQARFLASRGFDPTSFLG